MITPQYLLDTNIAIYLMEGTAPAAAQRLEACPLGSVVTSSICLAEILMGTGPAGRPVLDALLTQIAVLPFDEAAAEAYATIPFRRRSFDRLIGAHALSQGLIIITGNTIDFADIPGLRVEDWTQP